MLEVFLYNERALMDAEHEDGDGRGVLCEFDGRCVLHEGAMQEHFQTARRCW